MDREKLIKDIEKQMSEPTNDYVVLWFSEAEYFLELLKEHEELKSRHKILVNECDKMYSTLKEKNKTIEELEDDLAMTKDMLNHYLNGNE